MIQLNLTVRSLQDIPAAIAANTVDGYIPDQIIIDIKPKAKHVSKLK